MTRFLTSATPSFTGLALVLVLGLAGRASLWNFRPAADVQRLSRKGTMKFFSPGADRSGLAEEMYQAIRWRIQKTTGWAIGEARIYAVEWEHNGQHYRACVDELDPYHGERVCAIFASNSYLICTPRHGFVSGEPIQIGQPTAITLFDAAPEPIQRRGPDRPLSADSVRLAGPWPKAAADPDRGGTHMVVKGFQLPDFVRLIGDLDFYGDDSAPPDDDFDSPLDLVDAYGNPWYADLEIYPTPAVIERQNRLIEENMRMDPNTPRPGGPGHCPGFIPYIDDYSQIVCFGASGSGEPYCFDFRDNPDKPSIIKWDDVYWTRIAPDFESLLTLLEPFRV
jgi:hypothetical protein